MTEEKRRKSASFVVKKKSREKRNSIMLSLRGNMSKIGCQKSSKNEITRHIKSRGLRISNSKEKTRQKQK